MFPGNFHPIPETCTESYGCKSKRFLAGLAGHVGSHSDQEILEMTRVIAESPLVYFLVPQMDHYLRGRRVGEISKLVLDELRLFGF